ncbi:hypothetical protein N7495_003198 [Penicillium taxi]|uniref:uncharacterized protein n=1 Tax=Penicillium taxi TaxID=168475 RepID=UPI002544D607|nr:uncharacterized protein N7495_003198 [Penicillium taxi]KAJ5902670.1 hypothetical protein N7495_003198 [Penicillium taxi]
MGGDHANEMLSFLDYALIKSSPKILIEYSGITWLHWIIAPRTCAHSKDQAYFLNHFSDAVGPLPRPNPYPCNTTVALNAHELAETPLWRWLVVQATGHLFSGFVGPVVRLQGAKYALETWKEKIMFLESSIGGVELSPYSITSFRSSTVDLVLL